MFFFLVSHIVATTLKQREGNIVSVIGATRAESSLIVGCSLFVLALLDLTFIIVFSTGLAHVAFVQENGAG